MSRRVALHHDTRYEYDRPTSLSPQLIRLRPAPHCRTPVRAYSLKVGPGRHFSNWQQDPFGNFVARYVFPDAVRELRIEVDLVVDLVRINPFDFFVEDDAREFPFAYKPALERQLRPYLDLTEHGPLFRRRLARIDRTRRNPVDFLVDLNREISREVEYSIRMEPGVQTAEQTMEKGVGSCRDSAWLLVQILRGLGLAARFASGYIVQLAADEKALDGPSGPETDFTDLHAWTEVFLPGAGWIGLDPTSGLFAGEGHIPLCCTPEPADAAPVSGTTSRTETTFHFANSVLRIREDASVAKPYRGDEWERIERAAARVEQSLRAGDVRLTMGGEPTFVSVDDMDGPEWTVAALGPEKRRRAGILLRRLRDRFAPGGLLHFGQGKWYPGEELPRWSLACFWRRDGEPVWRDKALVAEDHAPRGHGVEEARRFVRALAADLGVPPDSAVEGFEDAYYYLWKEGALPVNVDPLKFDLKDSTERRRLARLLERGLDRVAGYAMPLRWDDGWRSARWEFRRGRMYLIPGDSPMGYRLPLDSLPWVPPGDRPIDAEPCPIAPKPPLGDVLGEVRRRYSEPLRQFPGRDDASSDLARAGEAPDDAPLATDEGFAAGEVVRTALCVEPRDGHLHVFLPPFHHAEHALDLVAAVERVAASLGMPVFVEGYPLPEDPRLASFRLTPDPGVIEANMQPGASWEELKEIHLALHEEARLSRLAAEKFMIDGRHTGTGGGHHITLGGPTPAESPFLRRPDLLRSLVSFWQHHPSLSYLFSGLFIGPTSQAPRPDEARDESVYDMEIALSRLPTGDAPPWIVDRVMRNVLVDVTGNTHRSEFSIDKLYSPAGFSGRQGLVELRAFEMPPHPRMSLVQMLLVRAAVARFWNEPYAPAKLVRWGTELHDRFMLPHYVREDLRDALEHLRRGGFDLDLSWFDAFHEFRFPKYGDAQIGDLNLELRLALEPWDVLGEEVHRGTTARFVDSSVERVQVKVEGAIDSRHVVACNGRRVPLRPTGRRGEFVAGVRFQAWRPPSSKHPTIPVHAPLVFDVVDLWAGRSIGGCTYHVMHPGGRAYDTFPVNAWEAESRRIARFEPRGHTPGACSPPPEERTADCPWTLDLRRAPER